MKKIVKVIMATLILCPLTPVTQAIFVDVASADTVENVKPVVLSGVAVGRKWVAGTAAPGSSVDLWNAGNKIMTVTTSYTGHWSAETNGLIAGIVQVRATLNGVYVDSDQYPVLEQNTKPIITSELVSGVRTVSGTATPGALIELWGGRTKGTATNADSTGHWTITFTSDPGLVDDSVQVQSTFSGSTLYSDKQNVPVLENTKPIITSGAVVGSKTISGTATPRASVGVWNTGNKVTQVSADTEGNWTATVDSGVVAGNVQVRASLRDEFLDSDKYTVNVKPIVLSGVENGSKTVSGTAAPGASVDVWNVGNKVATVTANSDGNWTATLTSGLVAGYVQVRATLGSEFLDSDQYTVNVKPIVLSGVVTGSKTVTGTAAPGASVDVWNTGDKVATVTADSEGNWTATFTLYGGLTSGYVQVRATFRGEFLDSDQYTVNVKPIVLSGAVDRSKIVSGTAVPGASVDVWNVGNKVATVTANSEGNWTATLTSGLVAGYVQVRATIDGMYVDSDQCTVTDFIKPEMKSLNHNKITGIANPGSHVQVMCDCIEYLGNPLVIYGGKDGAPIGTAIADSEGNWTCYVVSGYELLSNMKFQMIVDGVDSHVYSVGSFSHHEDSGVSITFDWGDFEWPSLFPIN